MAKPKKIKISISSPCSENWDQMKPDERGKFCAHCQKPVIDFSNYTNKELIEFFSKVKESVCGRVNNIQLNTVLTSPQYSDTPFYKRLLLGGAFAAGAIGTVSGQNNTHYPTQYLEPIKTPDILPLDGKPHGDSINHISGVVINSETTEPISFAEISIMLMGDSLPLKNGVSFEEGLFTIYLDDSLIGKTITVSVNIDGYVINTTNIYIEKLPFTGIVIVMEKKPDLSAFSVGGVGAVEVLSSSSDYLGPFPTNMEVENNISNTPGVHVSGSGSVFPTNNPGGHK